MKVTLNSMQKLQLSKTDPNKRKIAVISHERSGTHFLMNTLAMNFDYDSENWWNLDYHTGINFYSPQAILQYLDQARGKAIINILKSHHTADFFNGILADVLSEFDIFYIYRDPRDTLISTWNLFQKFGWDEGPRCYNPGQFIREAPSGGMMRYQKVNHQNIVQRWVNHVEGWIKSAQKHPRIHLIQYEELNLNFDETLKGIASKLNLELSAIKRPSSTKNVIGSGPAKVGGQRSLLRRDDLAFITEHAGELMTKLGYLD